MIKYSKANNLSLVALCLALSIFRGRAIKKIDAPDRIVAVFLTPNIGDMIFATPVFRSIKDAYPSSKLTVIGRSKNKSILEGNPDVDQYIECPTKVWELVKVLRRTKADYGFSLSISTFDLATLYLAGIPLVAGFEPKNANLGTRTYPFILNLCAKVPFYIGRYYAREYLRILEPISIYSDNTTKHLYYSEEAKKKIAKLLEDRGLEGKRLVIFSPGAGTKVKIWPADRYSALADSLSDMKDVAVVVIGGPGDKHEVEHFLSNLKKIKPLVFMESSLDLLKALIARGYLLVSNDSGPVFIAEAFDVPTLVLVGPTDENEHPPQGVFNRIVKSRNEDAEMKGHLGTHAEEKARSQILAITVDHAKSELLDLLKALKTDKKEQ